MCGEEERASHYETMMRGKSCDIVVMMMINDNDNGMGGLGGWVSWTRIEDSKWQHQTHSRWEKKVL